MHLTLIGGRFARKKLRFIEKIRPTSTKVRKAVFTVLGEKLAGGTFLDLFAGSGAVGIEALSRGADRVIFVEKDPEVVKLIEKNLSLVGEPCVINPARIPERGCVVLQWGIKRSLKFLKEKGIRARYVYIDPPYYGRWERTVMKALSEYPVLEDGARVFLEHYKKTKIQPWGNLVPIKTRRYGDTCVTEFAYAKEASPKEQTGL